MKRPLCVGLFLACGYSASAQQSYPTKLTPDFEARPDVQSALTFIDKNFESQVAEWKRIVEIPAPTGREQQRAAYMAGEFRKVGLDVTTDQLGNVAGRRKGTEPGPALVIAAHMDTVFPAETDVRVRMDADGTMRAPGAGDDAAGLANLLQLARALNAAQVRTRSDIVFLATVSEEVDFKGITYWLNQNRDKVGILIALDGGGGRVSYGALGSKWSTMKFSAQGAHTLQSRGRPNPVRAAAQCISDIYTIPLPPIGDPVPVYLNAGGMMRSGTAVNAMPAEVTFTVDLRTIDPELLRVADAAIMEKCQAAADAQKVTFSREFIQDQKAGGRPEALTKQRAHPLVQTAIDALRRTGVEMSSGEAAANPSGSTDANAGVHLGIPSVAIGTMLGADAHSLQESARTETAKPFTKALLLIATAMAEPAR